MKKDMVDELRERIAEEDQRVDGDMRRGAPDYPSYRENVGYLRGLAFLEKCIKDITHPQSQEEQHEEQPPIEETES